MLHRRRDPRQVRYLTLANLRWVHRNRAWTPFYLIRYARLLRLRLFHPEVVTEGMVFLGRRTKVYGRRGFGRVVLGRWVHIGDETHLRAHEGTLRVGDKTVFGRHTTVNCYLDIEIGARTLVADWVHITDFDHRFDDLDTPIKDQGIVKSPVRIGPDCWLGVKSSVLRGADVGRGCVIAAHAVVRSVLDDFSIAGGVPARVIKSRLAGQRSRRRPTPMR
ncbi:acyltransferase [Phytoactinopolyspora halotolerans]|uniref:Acyltransferase n=1 Tax=Phytoactinopolyspora halotolerans TaxID=1981512 RepID=A0A6L9S8L1_9ACTN|nr:acyltransferase [Phytoactinopolyspora halotolerans]NEE00934.1 acyltransferase [Phytoactinopolyspora halotolerans]